MIEWYEDKELGIYFNKMPDVGIRFAIPAYTKDKIKEINEKPFINYSPLETYIVKHNDYKRYSFIIPTQYTWDGASIPCVFWQLIGSKCDNRFLIPSLIHDYMCENKDVIDYDRKLSSKVFKCLLKAGKTGKIKSNVMYFAVNGWQSFKKWKK